jgi:hypothetical protein
MATMNVGWGAPRIHGELLKLGIEISEITVSRYMPEVPAPMGSRQRWATFFRNHLHESLSIDFAVVGDRKNSSSGIRVGPMSSCFPCRMG